jgi:hypothetical protein
MIVQYPDGNFRFRVLHHFLSWFRQQKKIRKKKPISNHKLTEISIFVF